MSFFPNCRTDEDYNEKYLNEIDSQYISGFDICTESVDKFFNNLDIFECKEDGFDLYNYLESHNEVRESLKKDILTFLERERNEYIVSIMVGYAEDDYDKIRASVEDGTYKNAIVRIKEWNEKFLRGEIPTAYEIKKDPVTGEIVKSLIFPNMQEKEE